jgi:hypothetical protein
MMMQRFKRRQTSRFRQRTPSVTDSSASSSVLNLQSRLDQQQERERNSFETLQDGLMKLTSMASQLAVAIGMQTTKVFGY